MLKPSEIALLRQSKQEIARKLMGARHAAAAGAN